MKSEQATCTMCGEFSAQRRTITTESGDVVVNDCTICDRGRCPNCKRPLPGNAMKCPGCSSFTWYRAGEANLEPYPATLAAAVARADRARDLVRGLRTAGHPELPLAVVELEQADKAVAHLRRQDRAA